MQLVQLATAKDVGLMFGIDDVPANFWSQDLIFSKVKNFCHEGNYSYFLKDKMLLSGKKQVQRKLLIGI